MGSISTIKSDENEELKDVLKTVKEKSPEIINESILKKKAIDSSKEKLLKKRSEAIEEAIANKKNNDDIKNMLKKYNLDELNIEKEYLMNEIEKMHGLYELGLDLSEPAKKATLKQIEKGTSSICCASSIISHINKLSAKEFFHSKYGKPLKSAIEKQGMNESILIDKKTELLEDRKKRREEEKAKYNLEQNEFPPEDDLNIDTNKIYEAIFNEYANFNEDFRRMHLGLDMIENLQEINN